MLVSLKFTPPLTLRPLETRAGAGATTVSHPAPLRKRAAPILLPRFRAVAALLALGGLTACVSPGDAGSAGQAAHSQTAQSAVTIDPTYRLAPEQETAAARELGLREAPFIRTAAGIAIENGDAASAAIHLSQLYDLEPSDRRVVFDYARHLRYMGAIPVARQVLANGLALYPDDPLLRLERAKLDLADGRAEAAATALEALRAEQPNDPAILQALGVSLDRLGEPERAQAIYAEAIATGRPTAPLLNNAALSHLISGDLERAEALLRQAEAAPGASPQVRQNLALTLSLKGDETAARAIANQSLPATMADAAVDAYLDIAAADHPWDRLTAE